MLIIKNKRNKNRIKVILTLLITILVGGLLIFSQKAQANSSLIVKTCQSPNNCVLLDDNNHQSLFNNTNFLPGQKVIRWIEVINQSGQPQKVAVEPINYFGFPDPNDVPSNDLSRVLMITIGKYQGVDLYGGNSQGGAKTLFDFYQEGEIYLDNLLTDNSEKYEFEIYFPEDKKDEWQGKTTNFDLLICYQGVEGNNDSNKPNEDNNSGGGGGGTPLPPGLVIKYEKPFVVGTTTAKIVWSTSHQATSRVVYGTESGVFDLNNSPNYGYQFSTSEQDAPANPNGVISHQVLLTNLQPNTTYYYRCISHGSPLAVSQEHGFTTLAIKKTVVDGQEIHQISSQENKLNQNKNNQQNTELKNETNLSNNNLVAGKNSESGANNPTSASASKLKLTPNRSGTPLSTTTKTNKPRFNPFLASIGSALTLGTDKAGVGIFVGLTILALIISIVWWKKKK
ncbi:MAG TPA: hypothetical protein ENL06_00815 [Candidatus Portnoybacteria bacterium]|nr:hypothetical protein [Candidatus Portnoybacteria bacterium]